MRRFGFQKKVILVMVALTMIPVILMGVILDRLSKSAIVEQLNSLCGKNLEVATWQIKSKFDVVMSTLQQIPQSQVILDAARQEISTVDDLDATQRRIQQTLFNPSSLLALSNPSVYAIAFRDGACFTSYAYASVEVNDSVRENLEQCGWYHSLLGRPYSSYSLHSGDNLFHASGGEQLYFCGNIMVDGRNEGVAVVGISRNYLQQMLRHFQVTDGSYVYLSTLDGGVWISSDGTPWGPDSLSYENGSVVEWDGQEYLAWQSGIDPYGGVGPEWTLRTLVPISDIYADASQLTAVTLLMVLITCGLVLVMIIITRRSLLQPLERLSRGMDRVQKGDLTTQVEVTSKDELGDLCDGFNTMVQALDVGIQRIQDNEHKRHELELQILQEQINPHFVKNTLNTIRRMADMRGALGVSRALGAFLVMIDYSFRSGRFVRLRDELYYLEQYVYIQEIRYQNLFTYGTDVPDDLLDARLPKLILQPLVENSVLHGVVGQENGGSIRVEAEARDGELWLHVRDDGAGMTAAQVERIMVQTEEEPERRGKAHIGLFNVRSRLSMIYGARFDMQISSRPNGGTHVQLRLPLQFERSVTDEQSADPSDR